MCKEYQMLGGQEVFFDKQDKVIWICPEIRLELLQNITLYSELKKITPSVH